MKGIIIIYAHVVPNLYDFLSAVGFNVPHKTTSPTGLDMKVSSFLILGEHSSRIMLYSLDL